MLLTLKYMDNLQWIESHQIICNLFFFINLTCCIFDDLREITLPHSFQNNYSKQIKHLPPSFPQGEIKISGYGMEMGMSLQSQKFQLSPSVGDYSHQ